MRDAEDVDIDAERVSGENVRENILVDEPTCHSCPVACKKEVEVTTMHKGEEMNVRTESYEYESAYALGPNSGHTDRDAVALMIDRCNDMGVDTIDAGNMMAMAMEMSEEGKLEEGDLEWGDYETMIDMIERSPTARTTSRICWPRGRAGLQGKKTPRRTRSPSRVRPSRPTTRAV